MEEDMLVGPKQEDVLIRRKYEGLIILTTRTELATTTRPVKTTILATNKLARTRVARMTWLTTTMWMMIMWTTTTGLAGTQLAMTPESRDPIEDKDWIGDQRVDDKDLVIHRPGS